MRTRERSRSVVLSLAVAPVLLLAALAVCLAVRPGLAGSCPKVVTTEPAKGAVDVAASVSEIRIEFDQNMETDSYSFVGGGPLFPAATGQPSWIEGRVCVLPVRLEPGHDYVFSVNSDQHGGFRSVEGGPAIPYRVYFRTAGATTGKALDVDSERGAIVKLRQFVAEQYSYRDRLGLDWDRLFDEHRAALEGSPTPRAFAENAAVLLGAARDIHVWLEVDGDVVPTHQRRAPLNFDVAAIKKSVPELEKVSRAVTLGRFPDGTGYLLLGSLERDQVQADQVVGLFERFQDAPALILDLRTNSGGDESLAQSIAGGFVEQPVVYARHVLCDQKSPGGYTEPIDRVLTPAARHSQFHGKIAVLQGRYTMSSAEALVLMMRQVPRCFTVGDTTYGSSGNPKPFDLGNGVTVELPSWKSMDATGHEIEGRGIAPDVVVPTTPEAFQAGDPVLAKARELVAAP